MSKSSDIRTSCSAPVVSIYPLGVTAGCPPGLSSHHREERSSVSGWSQRSARGNTYFLYSVIPELLKGCGYALTLTLRTCPPTHDDWKHIRERFFQSLRRRGVIRIHWVTEWQRRGVPHLHAAVWFEEKCPDDIIFLWLFAASDYTPLPHCQTVARIHDATGWFKYLAKHAARGVAHYQRSSANRPDGWLHTRRMWGKTGSWPTQEPGKQALMWPEYWRFRRLARSWRRSYTRHRLEQRRASSLDLRQVPKSERKAVSGARKMLRCHGPKLSAVRGISDWVPIEVSLQMLHCCIQAGVNGYRRPTTSG